MAEADSLLLCQTDMRACSYTSVLADELFTLIVVQDNNRWSKAQPAMNNDVRRIAIF